MIDIRLFAVFGYPILHSKSPQIFNEAFNNLGINAYYTRIRPKSASEIATIIKSIPLDGANITAPYKEHIINYLDDISIAAKKIGAVNTIVNKQGKLIGHNTDYHGVSESLKKANIRINGSKCLVLGGGGAAKAAVYGAINNGAQVFICNRTYSKAKAISDKFGCRLIDWDNFDFSVDFDVIISTLLPDVFPPFIKDIKFNALFSASYKFSEIESYAQKNGMQIINGEQWLLYQAAKAFTLFINSDAPLNVMKKGIIKTMDKDNIKILGYPTIKTNEILENNIDLLISSQGLNALQIKDIVDEERDLAFGN